MKELINRGSALTLEVPFDTTVKELSSVGTGVFTVRISEELGIHLKMASSLTLPKKIYGADPVFAKRVIKTFKETNKSLGVLLSGLKGTGKTVTAKLIALESNLPIIKLDVSYKASVLQQVLTFLSEIPFPFVLLVDEFEKLFDEEDQLKFLPFLDGINSIPVLSIFTINEDRISDYLKNRLQRIRYNKKYSQFDLDVACEVFNDLVHEDKKHLLPDFLKIIKFNRMCTMDIIIGLIQEINIHGKDVFADTSILNLEIERFKSWEKFNVTVCDASTEKDIFEGSNLVSGKYPSIIPGSDLNTIMYNPGVSRLYWAYKMFKGWKITFQFEITGAIPLLKHDSIASMLKPHYVSLSLEEDPYGDTTMEFYPGKDFKHFEAIAVPRIEGVWKSIQGTSQESKFKGFFTHIPELVGALDPILKNLQELDEEEKLIAITDISFPANDRTKSFAF